MGIESSGWTTQRGRLKECKPEIFFDILKRMRSRKNFCGRKHEDCSFDGERCMHYENSLFVPTDDDEKPNLAYLHQIVRWII